MRPCVRSDLGHGGTAAAPVSAARTAGVHGVQEFLRAINKEAAVGATPSPDGMGGPECGQTVKLQQPPRFARHRQRPGDWRGRAMK